MFYFYILKSTKDKNLYWGFTKDLKTRLKEHNAGLNKSTKQRRPLELIYYESYLSEIDARSREKQIKRRSGALISLKKRIKNSILNIIR